MSRELFFDRVFKLSKLIITRRFIHSLTLCLVLTAADKGRAFLSAVTNSNPGQVVDAYLSAVCSRYPAHRYVVGLSAQVFYRILWNLPESISDFILCSKRPFPENYRKSWRFLLVIIIYVMFNVRPCVRRFGSYQLLWWIYESGYNERLCSFIILSLNWISIDDSVSHCYKLVRFYIFLTNKLNILIYKFILFNLVSSVQEECQSLYLKPIHIVPQNRQLGAYLLWIKQNYPAIWHQIASCINLISLNLLPLNLGISWATILEKIEKKIVRTTCSSCIYFNIDI